MIRAVSYTHLDVYKRQQSQSVKTPSVMRLVEERAFSENQVVAAGKSLIPRQLRGIEPLSKVMRREAELQRGEQPVSYTHLDVYKRQPWRVSARFPTLCT